MYSLDEKEWFLLLFLAKQGALTESIKITTQQIADAIGSTQQTVSRRLKALIENGQVERVIQDKTPILNISELGKKSLKNVYFSLNELFAEGRNKQTFYGKIQTGMGEGAYYIGLSTYFDGFTKLLGSKPFLGTLNIHLDPEYIDNYYFKLDSLHSYEIPGFKTDNRTFGPVRCYFVYVCRVDNGSKPVKSLILDIHRTSHKRGIVEIVSNYNLREKLGLDDNARVGIRFFQ